MEHGIKVIERIFGKRLRNVVKLDEMLVGFMPERGTNHRCGLYTETDVRKMRNSRKEIFNDLEKAFDRTPREEI